ncbi:MAG: type IV toxin-antitoxin system AbiEi family antitoxin domain-containing protein [Acidimicrobiales bacterium]
MERHQQAKIALLQESQLGLVTSAQLAKLGASYQLVRTQVSKGRWQVVARGLYRVVGSQPSWDQRALGACLGAGPDAVLSHEAAAAVLGLAGARRQLIEVSVPKGRRATAVDRLALVHHPRALGREDVARMGALPITQPARTLIDLAERLSPGALQRMLDDVLCRRLTSRDRLLRRVKALTGAGRAGSSALRAALEAWQTGRPADSPAELDLARFLAKHGVPEPERLHQVLHDGRVVATVDLAWPVARLALELDSETWHGGGRAYHRDKARALRLAAAGWDVLAVTPANIRDGSGPDLVRAVHERLAARRHLPESEHTFGEHGGGQATDLRDRGPRQSLDTLSVAMAR